MPLHKTWGEERGFRISGRGNMTRSSGRFPYLFLHSRCTGLHPSVFLAYYEQSSVSHPVGDLFSPFDPADPGACPSQSRLRDSNGQDFVRAQALVQREQVRRLGTARLKRDIPGNDAGFPVRRQGLHRLALPSRGIRNSPAGERTDYQEIHPQVMMRRRQHLQSGRN